MKNKIKDSYPNGKCPDCGEPIPEDVVSGQECKNCGHVFIPVQNKIKDSYPNGRCPDCREPIPEDVVSGQTCKGCGNIFKLSGKEGKKRCLACTECSMGVVGCTDDRTPHGHGCSKRCTECGIPFVDTHPHSNVCSRGTPIKDDVIHNNAHMRSQLKWKKEIG